MKSRYSDEEIKEAHATLMKWLKPGDTVYTILRHTSRSGMSRHISALALCNGTRMSKGGEKEVPYIWPCHLNYSINVLRDSPITSYQGHGTVKMAGCGMDMGFALVYELAHALFNDGYALRNQWI